VLPSRSLACFPGQKNQSINGALCQWYVGIGKPVDARLESFLWKIADAIFCVCRILAGLGYHCVLIIADGPFNPTVERNKQGFTNSRSECNMQVNGPQ
jgi:hypothetical protein